MRSMSLEQTTTLHAAFDDYPHTRPLMQGTIKSDRVAFDFTAIRPANRFFKPMVRELKFDVSEMAIATYVQAKAYGKPLVLLPATMMCRFQHGTILCNAARPLTPAELAGKRIGVRSYSQTTAVWVRGILENGVGLPCGLGEFSGRGYARDGRPLRLVRRLVRSAGGGKARSQGQGCA